MTDDSIVSIAQMCGNLSNLTTLKLDLANWRCGSDELFEEVGSLLS